MKPLHIGHYALTIICDEIAYIVRTKIHIQIVKMIDAMHLEIQSALFDFRIEMASIITT